MNSVFKRSRVQFLTFFCRGYIETPILRAATAEPNRKSTKALLLPRRESLHIFSFGPCRCVINIGQVKVPYHAAHLHMGKAIVGKCQTRLKPNSYISKGGRGLLLPIHPRGPSENGMSANFWSPLYMSLSNHGSGMTWSGSLKFLSYGESTRSWLKQLSASIIYELAESNPGLCSSL